MNAARLASFIKQGRKIVAIGRNYSEHVKELNNALPTEPVLFLKPTTSYVVHGGKIEIPSGVIAHHEVELGVVIGTGGRNIRKEDADSHIGGYALAIDVTARNVQDEVKRLGLPWTTAKGFDTFTPIGNFIPKRLVSNPQNLGLVLKVQDVVKQHGSTAQMLFPIPRLIEYISSIMTLEEADLILTGTPSGVGPIHAGDKVECSLSDNSTGQLLSALSVTAIDRQGGYKFSST